MKTFRQDHVYTHNWATVTSAFFRKYPNKFSSHVHSVDSFDCRYEPQTGVLTVYRIISVESKIPSWLKYLVCDNRAYVVEKITVNSRTKEMLVQSQNISGVSILNVQERCLYCSTEAGQTCFKQEISVDACLGKLEEYSILTMSKIAEQGRMVIESLCQ